MFATSFGVESARSEVRWRPVGYFCGFRVSFSLEVRDGINFAAVSTHSLSFLHVEVKVIGAVTRHAN